MNTPGYKLGFLASGRGSNVQAILAACQSGALQAQPAVVISNNADAGVLDIARQAQVATFHLSEKTAGSFDALDRAIRDCLQKHAVDLVVLAGYMKKLGPVTLDTFRHRIVNIHPSLLPKFGGRGMYGLHVHEAVIAAGETETGVTVHLVTAEYDQGQILASETVPVRPGDDAESLAGRVLAVEHSLYVRTLQQVVSGAIRLPDR